MVTFIVTGNPAETADVGTRAAAQEASAPPMPKHRNNFGFIRLFLAVLVVLQHAVFLADGNLNREPLYRVFHSLGMGSAAVFGFFVLSGFLITQSWLKTPKLLPYLRSRVLRIYPGFLAAAFVTIIVFGRLGANDASYFSQLHPLQIAKCVATLQIPGSLPAFQGSHDPGVLNRSLWTIPLEFLCYLMVPVAGMARLLSKRWLWPCLLVISLAVPEAALSRVVQAGISPSFRILVPGFLMLLPAFLAGMCFYLYQDRIRFTRFGVALALLVCLLSLRSAPAARIGLPLAGGYLLLGLAFADIPALRTVGQRVDLSYGIYLYHWPCQLLILSQVRWISPWLLFPISLSCAALLASCSWHLVERPALSIKQRCR